MIHNDDDLRATKNLLAIAESAYDALRAELLPDKPKAFELLSQGYKDEILGLRTAIAEYEKVTVPQTHGVEHTNSRDELQPATSE